MSSLTTAATITVVLFSPRWFYRGRLGLRRGTLLSVRLGLASLFLAGGPGISAGLFEVWHDEGAWWLHDSVTAITQTHDGYLWLGTYHGLVRFDGISFTVFDSSSVPELPNDRITSLYEGPDQVLWIGHETGHLTKIAAGRFQSVELSTNWTGGVVEAITSDEQGNVWLLNESGLLLRLSDGLTARTPGGATQLLKATLARLKDGQVWMTSNFQVAKLEHGHVVPVVFPGDATGAMHERVFPAADGGVWVLGNGRLRKWRDRTWQEDIEATPSLPGSINVVLETRYGLLAGTMREGLYLLGTGAKPQHFTRADGLSHDWVRALYTDREGSCWIGTGTGFDGLRPLKVQMVAPADNWQGCTVRSFIVEPDGATWVGTEGAGLYHFDGRNWTIYNESNGLLSRFVWSVLRTKEKELFVGTWGGGLFRLVGDRFESTGELSRITAPVTALYQALGGELWIGTHEGLYRYEQGKLVLVAGKDRFDLPDVRAITESSDGTLWFGMSGGGLGSLKNGALKQIRRVNGLGSDIVSCLCSDSDGTLWVGTADNGLTRYKEEKLCTISAAQGLPNKRISQIVDDQAGCLWLGSQGGIFRVSKTALQCLANGQAASIPCLNYGRTEGLTSQICPGGFQPGACRRADGRLWFATSRGLAILHPSEVTTNSVPPPVAIESFLVDGAPANAVRDHSQSSGAAGTRFDSLTGGQSDPPSDSPHLNISAGSAPIRIEPGHRRFEFHYMALSFVAPEKVRYRRLLQGLESDWVEAGPNRMAEYHFLAPGPYTFKVIACNNDSIWSKDITSLSFTVLPHLWQTLGFRVSSITGGAGVMAAGLLWAGRRRLRRQLELSERQHAIERERARIARDMHDELGATLTRISLLSESVRGEISAQPHVTADADQIYGTAREAIRAMDEIVWAVDPAHDTLDSLVAYLGRYAERFLGSVAIRCRLDVPLHVPRWTLGADLRHNVFLAFKEGLHNVVKHARATEVRISVELNSTGFVLLVCDNGCGFVPDSSQSPQSASVDSARSSTGNGLANMRKRMEEIGGACSWDTAPGQGTRLKLVVSLTPH